MRKVKVSIVIPAQNRANRIADVVGDILPLARIFLEDFEIILIDDGSSDTTGSIMDRFASRDPKVRVIHNTRPMGDGFALKTALTAANFDAITLIPGDGSYRREGIARMLRAATAADLVIAYRENRCVTSRLTRTILNLSFGLRLVDHESLILYPVKWLREIPLETDSHIYQIRALLSLLSLGLTFVYVPVLVDPTARGRPLKRLIWNYLDLMISALPSFAAPQRASPVSLRRIQILKILAGRVRCRQNDPS